MESYHPTLWRTCRTLANAKRIRCLKAVLKEPAITVGEVAERARIAENHAGECLRALQARGLIEARRQSRWVRYVPVPDPLVSSAQPLLLALRKALLTEKRTEAAVIRVLTAFTHPRRLAILTRLKVDCAVSFEEIVRVTGISSPALYRHLAKLTVRGLVCSEDNQWRMASARDHLTKTLMALTLNKNA